ncbi:hypothetical protein NQZ68_014048 [Dissostichus eleginoides]|nr:hypothetical protein NQZ68_014048 [Dissostichus eleginoides]
METFHWVNVARHVARCIYANVITLEKAIMRSQGKQRLSGLKRRLCRALADGHTDPTEEGWAFIQNSSSQIHTAGLGLPATDITNGVQDKHHSK